MRAWRLLDTSTARLRGPACALGCTVQLPGAPSATGAGEAAPAAPRGGGCGAGAVRALGGGAAVWSLLPGSPTITGLSIDSIKFEREFEVQTAADHPEHSDWEDGVEMGKQALLRGKALFDGCTTLGEMRERLRVKIELLEALEADGFELSEEVTADRAFLWCRCPKPPHQRQAPDTWDDPPEDIC